MPAEPSPAEAPPARDAIPYLVWLGLTVLVSAPLLSAWWNPPLGHSFLGTLFYPDDFGQYLSFAEQAGRGAFAFINKFDPRPQTPSLVNLEWWLTGVLAIPLGGRLALAWHVLRLSAALALVLAFWRALGQQGPEQRRTWGLLLVLSGGGLGWLRIAQGAPPFRVPDVLTGLYPAQQVLSNTHFVVGAALLWWTVLLFVDYRCHEGRGVAWTACAYALALSRPYELAAFLVMAVADILLHPRPGAGPLAGRVRALLPLARLAPIGAYYGWLVTAGSFAGWGTQTGDLPIERLDLLWAVLPALLLVLASLHAPNPRTEKAVPLERLCAIWALGFLTAVMLWPAAPMRQLSTSLGASLLLLVAARLPPRWLPAAVLALCPTSAVLLWRAFHPPPAIFVRDDYAAAVETLRTGCQPRDVAIAPADLSLLIAMRTACNVVLGHRLLVSPSEVAEAQRFYLGPADPQWRLDYLRRKDAAFVFLPAGRGPWLDREPPYKPVMATPIFELWRRVEASASLPGR